MIIWTKGGRSRRRQDLKQGRTEEQNKATKVGDEGILLGQNYLDLLLCFGNLILHSTPRIITTDRPWLSTN